MWLFTVEGVYSVVQKNPKDKQLCIRARCAADLDHLRDAYLPTLGKTITNQGTDYPFRAFADREAIALAAADAVRGINYSNFKSEVQRRYGKEGKSRMDVFHRVWAALLGLEPPRKRWSKEDKLWDDDVWWEEEIPSGGAGEEHLIATCPICQEKVPLLNDDVDVSLPDDELFAAINKVAEEIGRECEWNDTGHHYGSMFAMDALGVPSSEQVG